MTRSCKAFVTPMQRTGPTLLVMADIVAAVGLVLAVFGIIALLASARPRRCRTCGVAAVAVEEYELSSAPRVTAITDRCPRCGEVVARRTIGARAD
jgi:hypothetical protein